MLDTHILIWAVREPERLPDAERQRLEDTPNTLAFSSASVRARGVPRSRGPAAARAARGSLARDARDRRARDPRRWLPPQHKDPTGRILMAQAEVEGATLLTADATTARCAGPVRPVG